MVVILVPILIVGSGLLVLTAIVLRSILLPRRIEAIHRMLRQDRSAAALRAAKALVARDPRNVDARFLLAQAYEKEEQPELALMELQAINRIGRFGERATEVAFRRAAGRLYEQFDQIEEALKEYLLLAKLEPDVAQHYYRCGELFERRGDQERALRYYAKAIQLDPNDATAHARLGHLLYRQGRYNEARQELDLAARLDPENGEAHFYLGKVLRETGDANAALTALEYAQKSPQFRKRALVERGGVFMTLKAYDRAIAELTRAIRIGGSEADTDTLYARYFLSIAYEKTRQLDKAIEQWEIIERAKPGFHDVPHKLAQYQDLRADDRVKDYITASRDAFVAICQDAVRNMGYSVNEVTDIPNGCQIIATEPESKWRNVRRMPLLVWFLRVPETITESAVRAMMEHMRKARIARGAIYASSGFSRSAREFAESRPIDLHGPEQLQRALALAEAQNTA